MGNLEISNILLNEQTLLPFGLFFYVAPVTVLYSYPSMLFVPCWPNQNIAGAS